MKQPVYLEDALEGIMGAVVSKLEDATATGELLDGVKKIVRGDRHDGVPPTPAIWVWAEPASNSHPPRSIQESWTMDIVLTPVVKAIKDSEFGRREATRLAARARTVVIRDRRLGLSYVQDTISDRFEASAPWHSDVKAGLFSAVAHIKITFNVYEPDL